MAETTVSILPERAENIHFSKEAESKSFWHWLALAAILLLSLWMNFYQLGQNGFGNLFYAAGVRSMLDSWHNFFFVSYDPGGFVTIDKPALGFWLQTLSAKLFGFTPFSIFFPQALSGVLAVGLLYLLVRRYFGSNAALIAALLLAISPISVVTNRNNTIDSTLALLLLLGAWAVLRAAETGHLRWLLLCALFVGLGFNVKMMEAYLVLPAFGLLYLLAAPHTLWTRIGHLALALLLLVAISFSWALAVDLTPASQRPYVGSSQNNSEIGLALGYNGVNRLVGGRGGAFRGNTNRGNTTRGNGSQRDATRGSQNNNNNNNPNSNPGNNPFPQRGSAGNPQDFQNFPAAGMFGTDQSGPLRLFQVSLGGQVSWFLPLALFGLLALAVLRRPRFQHDLQQQSMLLWGMWLLTMAVFFSVAGFFHQYYMTEMAPAIAALGGIGLVLMWRYYQLPGWRGWLLPLALLATAAEQIYLLQTYPQWSWLIPLLAFLVGLVALLLCLGRLLPYLRLSERSPRFLLPAISIAFLALLFAPTIWAALPVLANVENSSPTAGPQGRNFGFGFGNAPTTTRGNTNAQRGNFAADNARTSTALIQYLESQQGSTKFLLATPSSQSADAIILATNKPVMAMGGFGGSDPILTTQDLQSLISNHTVRFFLLNSPQAARGALDAIPEQYRAQARNFFGGGQNSLSNWVTTHCIMVPNTTWQSTTNASPVGGNQLYDCSVTR